MYDNNFSVDEYHTIKELVDRYHNGKIDLPDDKANLLAMKAYQYGIEFDVESKAIRKGLFDAADMASFGMLPNQWRPSSPGQDIHGEPMLDRIAGGAGTLLGLAGGIGLGVKGAQAIAGSFKTGGRAADALNKVKKTEAMTRSRELAKRIYNKGSNIIDPVPNFANFRYPI